MKNNKGKDPAFLMYSSDFLTGTMFMTDEQVGLYIRLLCVQHQHNGRINADAMQSQCARITNGDVVMAKFQCDDQGYFNARLQKEIELRAESALKKSIKAKDAATIRWSQTNMQTHCDSNADAMLAEDEIGIGNIDTNKDKKGKGGVGEKGLMVSKPKAECVPSSLESCLSYFTQLGHPEEASKFFDFFSSNGWKVSGRAPMKDWQASARGWCRRVNPTQSSNRRIVGKTTEQDIRNNFEHFKELWAQTKNNENQ